MVISTSQAVQAAMPELKARCGPKRADCITAIAGGFSRPETRVMSNPEMRHDDQC
jgi:hypothetical protein